MAGQIFGFRIDKLRSGVWDTKRNVLVCTVHLIQLGQDKYLTPKEMKRGERGMLHNEERHNLYHSYTVCLNLNKSRR